MAEDRNGNAPASMDNQTARNNRITALVLASIVAMFFFGIMLKYFLLK